MSRKLVLNQMVVNLMMSLSLLFIITFYSPDSLATDKLIFSSMKGAYSQKVSETVLIKAYSRLGITFETEWLPAKRSLIIANTGFSDGELSRVNLSVDRYPNLIKIKVPVNFIEGVAFTKNQSISVQNGWQSLAPYSIGITKGTIFAEKGTKGMNVQSVTNFLSVFQMLDKQRVDTVVSPKVIGLYHINQAGLKDIIVNKPALAKLNLYHYLHKRHADLALKLESVLQEMQSNREIEAIRLVYIDELKSGIVRP